MPVAEWIYVLLVGGRLRPADAEAWLVSCTREDQRVQEIIHRFHIGSAAPRVSHFIGGAPKAFTDSSMETAP